MGQSGIDTPHYIFVIYSNEKDIVEVFKTEDFRITFVWRGLCFRDENERSIFEKQLKDEDYMDLKIILKKLEDDMRSRGKISETESLESMGPKAFGKLLQKVYMQYSLYEKLLSSD